LRDEKLDFTINELLRIRGGNHTAPTQNTRRVKPAPKRRKVKR
jgi:hypothetical protein